MMSAITSNGGIAPEVNLSGAAVLSRGALKPRRVIYFLSMGLPDQ